MSHITKKQAHRLATSPLAMMRFKASGELPRVKKPGSPLITLLESMPEQIRMQMRGVRLSPKLGYRGGARFNNAHQLLKWLKPEEEMLEGQSWPAESCRDKRFQCRLSLDDLKEHCATWPSDELLKRARIF